MSTFIITYTQHFKKSIIRELEKIDKSSHIVEDFENNMSLLESNLEEQTFLVELNKSNPIFIKHICPAIKSGKIVASLEEDKKHILDTILSLGIQVAKNEKFSIQARIVSGGDKDQKVEYSSKDLEVYIGTYFDKLGGIPVFSDRKITTQENVKVISIIVNKMDFYLGVSNSCLNLNFNCDEYRTTSKNGSREISRAENKLKEALCRYNIVLSGKGKALDIGAAPGGWTKVLVDAGYEEVVAVDPGNLHKDLRDNKKIKHYKCKIEDLKFDNYFDIIVNDMNVDPIITAKIMNNLVGSLKEKGYAIVTLKLPNNPEKGIQEGFSELSKEYNVLHINSLFHNRQEVTTLLQKK